MEYTAYFDESGIHAGAAHTVVAGYFASAIRWSVFEQQWRAALQRHSIDELHTNELFDRRDAAAALEALVEVIADGGLFAIAAVVDNDAFAALNPGERRYFTGGHFTGRRDPTPDGWKLAWSKLRGGAPADPYHVAFQYCLIQAVRSAPDDDACVNYVFDQQHKYEGHALLVFDSARDSLSDALAQKLGNARFASRKDEVPLQAADLIAYCWNRYLRDENKDPRIHSVTGRLVQGNGIVQFNSEHFEASLAGHFTPEEREELRKQA